VPQARTALREGSWQVLPRESVQAASRRQEALRTENYYHHNDFNHYEHHNDFNHYEHHYD
jgi:hypothetical protein